MNHSISPSRIRNSIAGISVIFFSFYVLGTFFPDVWWTSHFLAFVPTSIQIGVLGLAGGLIVYSCFNPDKHSMPSKLQLSSSFRHWLIGLLSLGTGILMYQFPIVQDYYGDAYKVIPHLQQHISAIPAGTNEALFSFGLSPWEGHSSILAMVTYLAYVTGISYQQAFHLMDAVCGGLFVLVWLQFVQYYLRQTAWKIIMGLAGCTAPFMLIFWGHIESYAPVFLFFLLWMIGLVVYLQNRRQLMLIGLVLVWLICLKLHPIALLFLPALALIWVRHYANHLSWFSHLLTWEGLARWVLAPIFAAGAILYFFVFEDHCDPRSLEETAMAFDRLFLPLISPEAPLDNYNLLSFNHIFDYFAELLLWSPIALLVGTWLLISRRKSIQWDRPILLLSGLTLILFGSLFFMINPLLSMQLDWDLMAIPAPIFLVLVCSLVKEVELSDSGSGCLPPSLALTLLTLPIFLLHADEQMHAQRLESLGIRMYHSYYEWSGKVLQHALDMPTYASRKDYEDRKSALLTKLRPHAQADIDFEYAYLLLQEGKYHLRQSREYGVAMGYLEQANTYYPRDKNLLLYSMEGHFLRKEYDQAFQYAMELVNIQYPSEQKSIRIAIQCSLEAQEYEEALSLSHFYMQKWNDVEIIREVNHRLSHQIEVEKLRELFVQQP
ncbi:MAG: hypothetical protein AAF587_10060 [Bacteroidota bacterium]